MSPVADFFLGVLVLGAPSALVYAFKRMGDDNHMAITKARDALESNDRRRIENVLIGYRLPRKMRKAMERRANELLVEEIAGQ